MKWFLFGWIGVIASGLFAGVDGFIASRKKKNLRRLAHKMAAEAADGLVLTAALIVTISGHKFPRVFEMSLFWWLIIATRTAQIATLWLLSLSIQDKIDRSE